jgi:hypothetical protein
MNKLKHKNHSNEVTYCMNSGVKGTLNERGEFIKPQEVPKTADEIYLQNLLALVSSKMYERFPTLQKCFRYLDTDHSHSLTINEFAQAIEHMRLKISFEDVKRLFEYMDKSGDGEVGYKEFTLLLEERWRGIDPVSLVDSTKIVEKPLHNKFQLNNLFGESVPEHERMVRMENMARSQARILTRVKQDVTTGKINRQQIDQEDYKDHSELCAPTHQPQDNRM